MNAFHRLVTLKHGRSIDYPLIERLHRDRKRIFVMLDGYDPVYSCIRKCYNCGDLFSDGIIYMPIDMFFQLGATTDGILTSDNMQFPCSICDTLFNSTRYTKRDMLKNVNT